MASDLQKAPSAAAGQLTQVRRVIGLAILFLTSSAVGIVCPLAQAQTNEWTWISGGSKITCGATNCGQAGVYGTLGTTAPGNLPGGREGAATWIDNNGNLWLFGGVGLDANGNGGFLNDLWEFSPSTNKWTWVGGSSTLPGSCAGSTTVACGQPGVYGTLGTPSAGSMPGGRWLEVTWTDSSGNLWLFGGSGFDSGNGTYDAGRELFLNDLWKYTPSTGLWTWMGGSSSAVCPSGAQYYCGVSGAYGTEGVPASGNIPGGMAQASASTDSQGNFWLFGGYGNGAVLNDLWEFSPSTNLWTWVSGAPASERTGIYGVYGTEGAPASGNFPGSRYSATSWFDASGNFWLDAGYGFDVTGNSGFLDDLWELDPSTDEWVWVAGSNSATCSSSGPCPVSAVYGTLGVPAAADTPGDRFGASSWTDKSGNFWLFGSNAQYLNGTSVIAQNLNDLWEFNPPSQEWVWVNGSSKVNQPGAYGTMGTPASGNTPGGRYFASSWTDASGNLWLFGGEGLDSTGTTGNLNDLWEYKSQAVAWRAPTPTFSVSGGTYSTAQTVAISDALAGASIYYTTDGTTPTSASNLYATPIVVSTSEIVQAVAVASGSLSSGLASATYIIGTTNPVPVISGISPGFASAGAAGFTLTVNGFGFLANSAVYAGTTALTTTYGSGRVLTAQVSAANIASAGIYNITVQSPAPGGGTSKPLQFEVDSAGSGTTTFAAATATVAPGAAANYPVTLPSGSSNATASCLNLPAGAACTYSSATNPVTITTSSTTPTGTYQITVVFTVTEPGSTAGFILLPILLLPLAFYRRELASRHGWMTACMGLILLAGAATVLVACGGGSGSGSVGSTSAPQTHQATSSAGVTLIVQ